MSNAMVKHEEQQQITTATRAFEPASFVDAMQVAKALVESRLFPGIKSPEAAFALIATCRELGLSMMQSLRGLHVIEGKPTLSSDAMAGLCKSRKDVCAFFRMVESTDKLAVYETQRVGEPSPTRMQFSWEDAQRAGSTNKDNWRKYPAAMLRARCITALARAVYPDLLMGIYDPDELSREPVRGSYAVVSELPTETPPAPASEPRIVDLAPYEQAVSLATTVEDLVKVWGVAKSDGLGEEQLARVKGLCSAKRAELEGKAA